MNVAVCKWLNRASLNSYWHGKYKEAMSFIQQMTDYVGEA